MTHFAHVKNGIVDQVIVAEQDFINTLDDSKEWFQTSYNTHGNINKRTNKPIRKNYAGIGYTYDKIKDAFIPPKPFDSWLLNENKCLWEPPIPKPTDLNYYEWNENLIKWELV